jgi:transcriptional regulator with XRE-family HTH domain
MSPLEKYRKKLDSLSCLHKNLSRYRKEHELTHKEMANLLGIEKRRYSSYEYGIAEPSLKVAKEISEKIGVNLNELITGESEISKIEKIITNNVIKGMKIVESLNP